MAEAPEKSGWFRLYGGRVLLFLSAIPLGVGANYVTDWLRASAPDLTVSLDISERAGDQSVAVTLSNSGDTPLFGLRGLLRLRNVELYSITPRELSTYVMATDTTWSLAVPSSQEIDPGSTVELFFVLARASPFPSTREIASTFRSRFVVDREIAARPESSWRWPHGLVEWTLVVLLVVVFVGIGTVIALIQRIRGTHA